MKQRNDFLLPNELGWECNDKVSKLLDDWFDEMSEMLAQKFEIPTALWQVAKAELMDNMYAIIKECQNG